MFECVWIKEGVGDEVMSPGGVPPCGEQIAWALKGLKVSGVPSPPRTDQQETSAQKMGEHEEEGCRSVAGLKAGCWL